MTIIRACPGCCRGIPPTQACCLPDGSCIDDLTTEECFRKGGTPQLPDLLCAELNCPVFPGCQSCASCPNTLRFSITGFRADFVGGGIACEVTGVTTATRFPDICTWVGDEKIGRFPCEFFVTLLCSEVEHPDFIPPVPAGWVVGLHTQSPSPSVSYTRGPALSQCPPLGVYGVFGTFGGPGFDIIDPGVCEVSLI